VHHSKVGIRFIELAMLLVVFFPVSSLAQIYQLAEMNTDQLRALDRQKTVVILPGGILEEHGPYLPSYTDGYANAAMAKELAHAIAARPGWKVLVFPQVPLGHSGANDIGGKFYFPGSVTVRHSTLRAVYMDLAAQLGEQGFRWIFLVHDHGDPDHNRALDEASDFFTDSYHGVMVHLLGLKRMSSCCDMREKVLTPVQVKEDGLPVHAGVEETSQILFLRPELVRSDFRDAPSWSAANFEELYRLAEKPDWPGYFGAPRHASAALGALEFQAVVSALSGLALQILDGLDWRKLPRFADDVDPRDAQGESAVAANDRKIERRQLEWMKSHRISRGP
jgi:creatinine amidohydrolase